MTILEEAKIASGLGADVIMLDNLPPSKGVEVARVTRQANPEILIDVSGGIKSENVASYASCPDRISCGCLTHLVRSLDFSLEVMEKGGKIE